MACTYCVSSLGDHKRSPDELNAEEMTEQEILDVLAYLRATYGG